MKNSHLLKIPVLLLFSASLQGCLIAGPPMRLNCVKTGKGGVWIQADTSYDEGHTRWDYIDYSYDTYRHGLKNGRHYAYVMYNNNAPGCAGVQYCEEAGSYRKGHKAGLWLHYEHGYYYGWVYHIFNKSIHAKGEGPTDSGNTPHALSGCQCFDK